MKKLAAAAVVVAVFVSCRRDTAESNRHIILPNPELLRTCPTKQPQLWRNPRAGSKSIYPAKFHIHLAEGGCAYGFMVWYDKSVSLEDLRQAINQRYGKWELSDFAQPGSKMRLWRIESSERFVIQLAEIGEENKDKGPGDPGMKQLIYLPIAGRPLQCDCR